MFIHSLPYPAFEVFSQEQTWIILDGEGFYGEIPGFQGVYAQADTLEACRKELASTLEDWLLFRISRHLAIPTVEGLNLTVREVEVSA